MKRYLLIGVVVAAAVLAVLWINYDGRVVKTKSEAVIPKNTPRPITGLVQEPIKTNSNESNVKEIIKQLSQNGLQLDIFVLKKYESSNKGYGYILCIMDIFSRKAWCYAMKTKGLSDTTPGIKKFFSESGLHEFNKKALVIIMSDSDSSRIKQTWIPR